MQFSNGRRARMRSAQLMLSTAAAAVMATGAALAQESESSSQGYQLEEILVTAQKREATLLETPVAVSAIGGSTMELAQARDLTSLQTLVPSLQIVQRASASNTSFSVRGIGSSTFNFGLEPAVGVFVDGVYRSRNGASVNDFLGIERIEVLRGPQSTLFGKNTSAGVINYVTKAPHYDFEVEGELTYGNYDAKVGKAAVNVPLIEDQLAMRLDVNVNKRDGTIDNLDGRQLNERDRYGLRGQILWEPSDRTSVRIIGDYSDLNEECCAAPFYVITDQSQLALSVLGSDIVGAPAVKDRQTAIDGEVVVGNLESYGVSGQVDIDFETFTLTSITAFRGYRELQDIDADFSDLQLNKRRVLDQDYDTFTQEIRVTSTTDGPVEWMAGVYYYNQDLTADNQTIQGPGLRPFADVLTGGAISQLEAGLGVPAGTFLADGSGQQRGLFNQDNESYSAFVQLDWHVTDRFTLTGGIRYTHEKKSMVSDIVINDPFAALDFVQIFVGQAVQQAAAQAASQGVPPEVIQNVVIPQATAQASAVATNPDYNPLLGLTGLQFFPPAANVNDSFSDNNLSGNIIANMELDDNLTVYASYSRGFKAGGFALDSAAARVGDFRFDEEVSTSWELGLKARLMDNRMSLDFALFDQKVDGFQENIFTGSSFVPGNVDAKAQGLEFDGKFQATPELLLTGGFTWLWEAEYDNFPNGPCPAHDTSGCTFVAPEGGGILRPLQNLTGSRLSETPKFSGNATATYRRAINDNLEGFLRTELFYNSYTNLSVSQDERQFQDAYMLVGASVGVGDIDGAWSLQLWARNLFNEAYILDTFDSTIPGGSLNAYVGDPRTYGLTLRFRY
ncbi:TonB-dependent receptor [Kordiimonas gwangyangensis]|uniref:TonB-dependent receptor n=1 Tax=Kordiimonas gwangyangensis TaxID=288022 RepID=UPI000374CC1D|nr:TonB-dependent receptor [Kordiimonas gwangyangensis]